MEAAWRQTGPSFWLTAGRDLTTQMPQPPGWPKRLDPRCALTGQGPRGEPRQPRALPTLFLHKFKSFLSSPQASQFALVTRPRRQGKGRLSTIHNFHVIILTRSCISRSRGGGGGRRSPAQCPDLFYDLDIDSSHLCSKVFGTPPIAILGRRMISPMVDFTVRLLPSSKDKQHSRGNCNFHSTLILASRVGQN